MILIIQVKVSVYIFMGQIASKKNKIIENTTRQESHFCSIQIGSGTSFPLTFIDVQRQFGNTYVNFKLPSNQKNQLLHLQGGSRLDIQYQRTPSRHQNELCGSDMVTQLEKLQDSLQVSLTNQTPAKNIISGTEYQEYQCITTKGNNFTFRFGTQNRPNLIVRYMYQHN